MNERYSIEVNDEIVEIYGDLTIEEAFDFLNFFDKKGYKSVVLGSENSTLRMMKRDQQEVIHDEFVLTLKEQITDFKELWTKEQKSHEQTKSKLNSIELLLKTLMSEEHAKYKKLHEENMILLKAQCMSQMQDNPEFKKIMENYESEGTDKASTVDDGNKSSCY